MFRVEVCGSETILLSSESIPVSKWYEANTLNFGTANQIKEPLSKFINNFTNTSPKCVIDTFELY